jgi:Uncharacterized protein conserved in bacteria (DUF2330)
MLSKRPLPTRTRAAAEGIMNRLVLLVLVVAAQLLALPSALPGAGTSVARACGGLFCSRTPVDQNAERIVFKVRSDGRTDMIVQISYRGKAEDFAWLLPLGEPPAVEDLGTFPQAALNALDAQTGVVISGGCFNGAGRAASSPSAVDEDAGGVNVYVRAQVGNYDVAVIGSSDASASAEWLHDNGFRLSEAMQGFLELYTAEGMKFLALKLLPDKDVTDITPFKLTLPGETPSIPLRLSAVAAEPEMGIVVWIFAEQRYEPANADELTIDNADLRLDPNTYGSNWTTLVARAADAAEGRGFVVENAQPIDSFRSFVQNSFANTPEQMEAQRELLGVLEGTRYMTRLYTRLSPEEMTFDPLFKRSSKGDVDRFRSAGNDNQCQQPPMGDACDFTACGSLGLCRTLADKSAACACAPGTTARTTLAPNANGQFTTSVSCIDKRLSFLNPGDKDSAGEALPDPCVGIDCGGHGSCVPMNMTPTCECERGYVARGAVGADGSRSTRCTEPTKSVPDAFYNRRAVARAADLPIGRDEVVAEPTEPSDPADPIAHGNGVARGGKSCALARADTSLSRSAAPLLLLAVVCGLRRARRRGR